jgi:hypothetical protein
MSEVFTNRSWQGPRDDAGREGGQAPPPRIQIDVPLGTSYQEIQVSIFRQAYQLAGTQLRAAIALGITPDTVSRVLRRSDRRNVACPQVPEAWPVVTLPEPPPAVHPGAGSSGHPTANSKDQSPDPAKSSDREAGRTEEEDRTDHRISEPSDRPPAMDRAKIAHDQVAALATSTASDPEASRPVLDSNNDDSKASEPHDAEGIDL